MDRCARVGHCHTALQPQVSGINNRGRSPNPGCRVHVTLSSLPLSHLARRFHVQGYVYSGQIEKGQMHGKGTLTYPSGEKYEGDWQWGKRHGFGRMTFPDGARYGEPPC